MKTKMRRRLLASVMSAALLTTAAASQFPETSTALAASDYDYGEALELSLYFFDGNQCGSEVDDNPLTWRGNCHTYDAEASLNNASGLSSASKSAIMAQNGGSSTVDVSGGYHDAGDHLKFSMTMGFSATSLAWSYYSYPQSYDETGATDHLKYVLKNTCDYFMKVTYLDSSNSVIAFCTMVGDDGDHAVWSSPETQTMTRTTYWADSSNPQSSTASEMAAALASSSLIFQNSDPDYAAECLKYANALLSFAKQSTGDTNLGVGSYYSSTSYKDDIAWAELWCALAGNGGKLPSSYTPTYKLSASGCYNSSEYDYYMYSWDKVWSGYAALLTEVGYDTSTYLQEIKFELNNQGGLTTSKYNAAGWGASRYNCALQMLALHIADASNDSSYAEAAKYQMDYILGNNPLNMSFLVGYGTSWPTRIHHRAANPGTGNPSDNTSAKYTLYGALIGGPDSSGNYEDKQDSYEFTEPALDYNGAFALAIAGLYARYGGTSTAADAVVAAASEITYPFDFGSGTQTTTDPVTEATTEATTVAPTEATTVAPTEATTAAPTEATTNSTSDTDAQVTSLGDNKWNIDVTDAIEVTVTADLGSNTSANGCIGYTDASGNWVQSNWNVSDKNKAKISFEIPDGVTDIQFQVWWPNDVSSVTATLTMADTDTNADVIYGDANCDGNVDILDVIALNKNLMGSSSLTTQGALNADVDRDGTPTSADALSIMRYCVKLISSLPV